MEDVTANKRKMKELEDNLLYRLTSTQGPWWKTSLILVLSKTKDSWGGDRSWKFQLRQKFKLTQPGRNIDPGSLVMKDKMSGKMKQEMRIRVEGRMLWKWWCMGWPFMFYAISLNIQQNWDEEILWWYKFLSTIIHVIGKFLKILMNLFLTRNLNQRRDIWLQISEAGVIHTAFVGCLISCLSLVTISLYFVCSLPNRKVPMKLSSLIHESANQCCLCYKGSLLK